MSFNHPEGRGNRVKSIFDDSDESENNDDISENSNDEEDNETAAGGGVFKISIKEVLASRSQGTDRQLKTWIPKEAPIKSPLPAKYIVGPSSVPDSPPVLNLNDAEIISVQSVPSKSPVFAPSHGSKYSSSASRSIPKYSTKKSSKTSSHSSKPILNEVSAYDSLSLIMGNIDPIIAEDEFQLPSSLNPVRSPNSHQAIKTNSNRVAKVSPLKPSPSTPENKFASQEFSNKTETVDDKLIPINRLNKESEDNDAIKSLENKNLSTPPTSLDQNAPLESVKLQSTSIDLPETVNPSLKTTQSSKKTSDETEKTNIQANNELENLSAVSHKATVHSETVNQREDSTSFKEKEDLFDESMVEEKNIHDEDEKDKQESLKEDNDDKSKNVSDGNDSLFGEVSDSSIEKGDDSIMEEDKDENLVEKDDEQALIEKDEGHTLMKKDDGQTLMEKDDGNTLKEIEDSHSLIDKDDNTTLMEKNNALMKKEKVVERETNKLEKNKYDDFMERDDNSPEKSKTQESPIKVKENQNLKSIDKVDLQQNPNSPHKSSTESPKKSLNEMDTDNLTDKNDTDTMESMKSNDLENKKVSPEDNITKENILSSKEKFESPDKTHDENTTDFNDKNESPQKDANSFSPNQLNVNMLKTFTCKENKNSPHNNELANIQPYRFNEDITEFNDLPANSSENIPEESRNPIDNQCGNVKYSQEPSTEIPNKLLETEITSNAMEVDEPSVSNESHIKEIDETTVNEKDSNSKMTSDKEQSSPDKEQSSSDKEQSSSDKEQSSPDKKQSSPDKEQSSSDKLNKETGLKDSENAILEDSVAEKNSQSVQSPAHNLLSEEEKMDVDTDVPINTEEKVIQNSPKTNENREITERNITEVQSPKQSEISPTKSITSDSDSLKDSEEKKVGTIRIRTNLIATPTKGNEEKPRLKINPSIFMKSQTPNESSNKTVTRVEDVYTDSEEDQLKNDLNATPVNLSKSKIRKRPERKGYTPQEMELFMVPFKYGWRREIVERAVATNSRSDVYYYAPAGKKLRSKVEVQVYIDKNEIKNVSIKNFTFSKLSLGADNDVEMYREAKPKATDSDNDIIKDVSSKKENLDNVQSPLSQPTTEKKQVQKKNVLLKQSQRKGIEKYIKTPYSKKLTKANNFPPPLKRFENLSLPSNANSNAPVKAILNHGTFAPVNIPRVITPMLSKEDSKKTYHCTSTCQNVMAIVPNIQCMQCLCLFHNECCKLPTMLLPLVVASTAKFLCPNCYREGKENNPPSIKQPEVLEPHAYDPSDSDSNEDEGVVPDAITNEEMFVREEDDDIICDTPPQNSFINRERTTPLYVQHSPALTKNMPSRIIYPKPVSNMIKLLPKGSLVPPMVVGANSSPSILSKNNNTMTYPQQSLVNNSSTPLSGLVVIKSPRFTNEFMHNVCMGYKILHLVFQYLNINDLLNAASVCTLWRDIALSPKLCNTVVLDHVLINDWGRFSKFMKEKETKVLDMRNTVIKKPSFLNDSGSDSEDKTCDSADDEESQESEDTNKTSQSYGKKRGREGSSSPKKPDSKRPRTESPEKTTGSKKQGPIDIELKTKLYKEELRITIGNALKSVPSLRKVILGNCSSDTAYTVLASCENLTSIVAMHLCTSIDGPVLFDAHQLENCKNLEEICFSSVKGVEFSDQFTFDQFINLKRLVLVDIKWDAGKYPVLNSDLTSLQLSPMIEYRNWSKISSMAGLRELHLSEYKNVNDDEFASALKGLSQLQCLSLINWHITPQLPAIVQATISLTKLTIVPAYELKDQDGIQAGRVMAMLEKMRFLRDFIWGIKSEFFVDVVEGEEHICVWPVKHGSVAYPLPGMSSKYVAVKKLNTLIETKLPFTKINIRYSNSDGSFQS